LLDELLPVEIINRYPKIDEAHAITVLGRKDHSHSIMCMKSLLGDVIANEK
jgi:hypothetical protein